MAWYGAEVVNSFVRDDMDVRSFDMPRWILVAFIPLSFAMMGLGSCAFIRGRISAGCPEEED